MGLEYQSSGFTNILSIDGMSSGTSGNVGKSISSEAYGEIANKKAIANESAEKNKSRARFAGFIGMGG